MIYWGNSVQTAPGELPSTAAWTGLIPLSRLHFLKNSFHTQMKIDTTETRTHSAVIFQQLLKVKMIRKEPILSIVGLIF
jgi:hypothetical protein